MVNFFYLDINPKKCAQYYCNKHIIKIPIEIVQFKENQRFSLNSRGKNKNLWFLFLPVQILSKVHYELKSNIDYDKIYKNSSVVKNTLEPLYKKSLEYG